MPLQLSCHWHHRSRLFLRIRLGNNRSLLGWLAARTLLGNMNRLNSMTDTFGAAFARYMDARLEQNEALLEWMRAAGEQEAEPFRRAEAARARRDSSADECVSILLQDPFSAKSEYESLRSRIRRKCDQSTWEKMNEHLQALDETFHYHYRRAWLVAAAKRYGPILVAGVLIGGGLMGYVIA